MPDTQKVPFGQSLGAKAAAVALAVSGALLLAIFLTGILPEKTSGWKNALPAPGMSETDARAALVRARYLHEASVRPRLIEAGLYLPGEADIAVDRYATPSSADDGIVSSRTLTEALWTLRAFPELHDAFLAMLRNPETPPEARAKNFYCRAGFLASVADALAGGSGRNFSAREYTGSSVRPESIAKWFAAFNDDPRLNPGADRDRRASASERKTPAQAIRDYEDRLSLAREVLPVILRGLDREMAARTALAAEEAARAKGGGTSGAKTRDDRDPAAEYLEYCSAGVSEAMRALWEQRMNPRFLPLAKELLDADTGTFFERCEAVPLIAQKPGLPVAEYLFWRKYKQDLDSVSACVGTAPRSYAYLLGCMDTLMTETTNRMKARGSFFLGGQTGPGVVMTRTAAFTPAKNLSGNLYLLADMGLAMKDAPEYDLSRAYPIFRGMLYRYLEDQPLVLPLNPGDPKDAAVLDWYADKGWALGRTVLFSAVGTPAEVAGHWGSVHLLWWPGRGKPKDADPDLAFLHPVSGHFMAGMLPRLKGNGVTRFLGPVTGMWFGRRTVDATGWVDEKYEARPEIAPAPSAARASSIRSPLLDWASGKPEPKETAPGYSEATATIVLGVDVRKALGEGYGHNYKIELARSIDETFGDASQPPLAVFRFVDNAVDTLAEWGITRDRDVRTAIGYLWQFRDDPKVEQRVRTILSQKELRPYKRMRKVGRVLGLPEKEN